jgi:rhamnosyltransferase
VVEHSHDYSVLQEARQFFDTGVMHTEQRWLLDSFGTATGDAMRFALSEYQYVRAAGIRWPAVNCAWRSTVRFAAYRLGRVHRIVPSSVKRRLTATPGYWNRSVSAPAVAAEHEPDSDES